MNSTESQERRELSAFDIGCVVIGGIIGVGIFFTPKAVAAAVDSPQQVMLAWGLGGLLAVLGALVFAELSLRVPGHGGVYRYLESAFGRTTAFLYGWANWLVIQAGALGGVAVVIVTYMTVNLAYLDLLGFEKARTSPAIGAAAAEVALGAGGGRILAGMVVISAAGILNTICMAPPYVLYAMAQQGCFPKAFGKLHPRFHTPVLGVLGQGLWGVLLLLGVHAFVTWRGDGNTTDSLDFVCNGVVFVDWLFYGLCGLALLVLRRRDPAAQGRVPLGGVVGFLFAFGALVVTVGAFWTKAHASATGAVLVLLGLVVRRWLR